MFYRLMPSPLGELLLAGSEDALKLISFPTGNKARAAEPGWQRRDDLFEKPVRQLAAYFDGKLRHFDLDYLLAVTEFQHAVLDELRRIPYGETATYSEVARRIGRPRAVRAVGAANGRNPLPIVIPCHRVVGADGTLTGFGGGLDAKRYLLDLEQRHL